MSEPALINTTCVFTPFFFHGGNMRSNFVGNTEENRIAALLDSRWLQRTERNGSGYIKGTITVTQDFLPYQTVPADTVLFQWLTRWCCPVTAEAAGSSPVVPAIFSNSCKTHRSLSCTTPTCAAKTRNIRPTTAHCGGPPAETTQDADALACAVGWGMWVYPDRAAEDKKLLT